MNEDVKVSEFSEQQEEDFGNEEPDEEVELEMLTEECEELINRLSSCVGISVLGD
jgi:hypothetical protein